MIRHVFKLVWNRRRTNALLAVEIFFSFLVLFAVVVSAVFLLDNWRKPLGFRYEHVWSVEIRGDEKWLTSPEGNAQVLHAMREVRALPEVEEVAGLEMAIFSTSSNGSDAKYGSRVIEARVNETTDEFARVMDLTLTRGRWFRASDDAFDSTAVVINERMARDLFGADDPLGKSLHPDTQQARTRVVGVISDFREDGELAAAGNYFMRRRSLTKPSGWSPHYLAVKVRPGTPASFEEKMVRRLEATLKNASFRAEPLTRSHRSMMRYALTPLLAFGLIAGFLLLMVALGMVGVLWQNVSRRTAELGLRRAVGATAQQIHTQVLGELLVIAAFGLLLGTAVVVQFPLLDLVSWLSTKVYAMGLFLSVAFLLGLTLLAGVYPSLQAGKVQPAAALRGE